MAKVINQSKLGITGIHDYVRDVVSHCDAVSDQALVAARLMVSGASFEDTIMRSDDPEWRYLVAKVYRY